MATVPLSGTNIKLLSGVPFSSDYKHTRWFDSKTEQTNWFLSRTVVYTVGDSTFQRIEGKNYCSVDKSIDDLWGVNYLMFQNTSYNSKWFYAFVTKLEYVNKKCTYVHFEIDVLQTWLFDIDFKPSFVVREHCKLRNADGTPVINTIDEGLNYGTDYDIVDVRHYNPGNGLFYMVAVTKTSVDGVLVDSYTGTKNGIPQLMNFYICPFKLDLTIPGCNLGTLSSPFDFLIALYTDQKAVNNVVSIYITDVLPDFPSYLNGTLTLDINHYALVNLTGPDSSNVPCVKAFNIDYSRISYDFGDKYSGFKSLNETKLFMYPYCVIILTDFKGNQIELKPEYIRDTNLSVNVRSSLGLMNKVVYTVSYYLTGNLSDPDERVEANLSGASVISDEPNDMPVLTDMLSAYLQGHKNSLENKKSQIGFNGQINAISGGANMALSILGKNLGGAINAGVGGIKGAVNTVYNLQAIEAKQQDISNTPPSLSKQGSNTYFDFGNGYAGLWVIKKQITDEYIKKLTAFFNMYGYKLNEVKVPNFHTRQNWNYVQTESCIIRGNLNVVDLNEIKQVFDKGITLWHTDDIGNYALSNGVIA